MLIKYFSLSITTHSTSNTFKVLRSSIVVKSQSMKYLHGPHTLDRAFIEHGKPSKRLKRSIRWSKLKSKLCSKLCSKP